MKITDVEHLEDLQVLVEAIPALVCLSDETSGIFFLNTVAREFFGVRGNFTFCEKPADILLPHNDKRFREMDQRVLSKDKDVEYREEFLNTAGERRSILIRKKLVTTSRRERLVVSILIDVTAVSETEEHYRHAIEANPQIPWTAARDGGIEEMGPRWEAVTGLMREEAMGKGWTQQVHPEDLPHVLGAWQASLFSGEPADFEFRVLSQDNDYFWFRAQASPRRNKEGEIVRWYGFLEEIHGRKLVEKALRENEERFRLAARAAGLGIWDYDPVSGTHNWSREFREMLGVPTATPAEPALLHELLPLAEDREIYKHLLEAAQSRKADQKFDETLRFHRYGEDDERWCRFNGWKILDEADRLKRLIIVIRDITEERRADERLQYAALHDPLTGLPNRSFFLAQLISAIESAVERGERVGLLMLDVDQLKHINDTYGHDVGDSLLQMFAKRLALLVRKEDTVARLGGDEFAIVLPHVSGKRGITRISDRIIAAMREPFIHGNFLLACKPSMGASHFPAHATSSEALIKSADLALYTAKSTSRGSLVMFHPRMRTNIKARESKIARARTALGNDQIFPFYQPKVELESKRIVGFEALLRWRQKLGAVQPPEGISPALADFELALEIGDRMLRRAVSDARDWLDGGTSFGSIALNAGAVELQDRSFADRFLERLRQGGVPPHLFQVEVVETVLLGRGVDRVEENLRALNQEGVLIALDDFGTGYASLSHLKKFPVDVIKIDQSFVRGMISEKGNLEIIDAVVGLGKSLGLKVVAEGVETAAQAEFLVKIGCTFGQGYYFSKAVAATDVPKLLSSSLLRNKDMNEF